jgi:hypothetical protein
VIKENLVKDKDLVFLARLAAIMATLIENFKGDDAANWVCAKNEKFGGLRPIDVVLEGNEEKMKNLWGILYRLREKDLDSLETNGKTS